MEKVCELFRGIALATVCFPTDTDEVRQLLASRGRVILLQAREQPLHSIVSKTFFKHQTSSSDVSAQGRRHIQRETFEERNQRVVCELTGSSLSGKGVSDPVPG